MNYLLLQQNNFKFILPEFFLGTSILFLTLYGTFLVTSNKLRHPIITKNISKLSILVLCFTLFLVFNISVPNSIIYQGTFISDYLSLSSKSLVLFFSILCLLISEKNIIKNRINQFEYFILFLSAVLGFMLLISSFDLISLYLAIELQSLCLYVLAASKKDSTFSTESGLKYFILGSFSSALLLFGISIIYGCTGSTNFSDLALLMEFISLEHLSSYYLSIEKGLLFIFVAFLFKISAAPFHMWSPDVYEGSPLSSTLFFAIVPKLALFTVFLRLFNVSFFNFYSLFFLITVLSSLSSVLIGSFAALKQKKLKRLMAFSSISHVGYLLLAFSTNSIEGIQFLFFYLIIYMVTTSGLWSIIVYLDNSIESGRGKTLSDFASLAKTNPILGLFSVLLIFSLAGVPPLAGFYAKMSIFLSVLNSSLVYPAIIAILISVVSSVYYIRLIKVVYFETNEDKIYFKPMDYGLSYVITFSVFFSVFFFLNPTLLLLVTQKMTLCLL